MREKLPLTILSALVVGASLASIENDDDRTWSLERLLRWHR
jgi:hypothetical protein